MLGIGGTNFIPFPFFFFQHKIMATLEPWLLSGALNLRNCLLQRPAGSSSCLWLAGGCVVGVRPLVTQVRITCSKEAVSSYYGGGGGWGGGGWDVKASMQL